MDSGGSVVAPNSAEMKTTNCYQVADITAQMGANGVNLTGTSQWDSWWRGVINQARPVTEIWLMIFLLDNDLF